ncbi:hypothetical protein CBI55_10885 [Pseudomonas syringae]|uniref:hypothetical protein n=1 Tax=Pseudomonas syringae TaxID=317 RepID=UPI000C1C9B5C|nr:hypothetical protein [Pseudomonas syringae]MCF9002067.1 hypothetical protein [Pseudomonas syringae]PIO93938.1 hypothetical protein CBI55_10885 [Pseudomonas syringae]POP81307.1 hypothetical protein CXB38_14545 [Pseudomonas syringae]
MAYELHIVRPMEIALGEWQSLCAIDPSMKLENELARRNPITGETIVSSGKNSAIWTSPLTQQQYLFDYRKGVISFVYSDAAIIKAKEIAKALAASVEGDEGEAY